MMLSQRLYKFITVFIAMVWLVNGVYCKLLGAVPRHQQIVGEILGYNHASAFTIMIGIAEVLMAGWILSGLYRRIAAIIQVVIVATMNLLEFILVPELLLWGRMNAVFATLFILLIIFNEFVIRKHLQSKANAAIS